jgi:hypothetical protein
MKVVAIDPGTHTGVAWGTWEPVVGWCKWKGNEETFGVEQVNCPDEVEGLKRIWAVIVREQPDVIVIEDFILLPPDAMKKKGGWSSARSGLSPTRIGFGLKVLLSIAHGDFGLEWTWLAPDGRRYLKERVAVVWQMPSMMAGVTEAELRRMGLWKTPTQIPGSKPGDGPHAMDALRHLLVWGKKQ